METTRENKDVLYPRKMSAEFELLKAKLIDIYSISIPDLIEISPLDGGLKVSLNELSMDVVEVKCPHTSFVNNRMVSPCRIKPIQSYRDIFFKGNVRKRNICLIGEAGTGKTTWCRKITNTWCRIHQQQQLERDYLDKSRQLTKWGISAHSGSDVRRTEKKNKASTHPSDEEILLHFDFLFLVRLELVNETCSFFETIRTSIMGKYPETHRIVDEVFQACPERVLVIADGFKTVSSAYIRKDVPGCTLLSTTRPSGYSKSASHGCKLNVLNINGLDDSGIRHLISRLLESDPCEGTVTECITKIEYVGLKESARTPAFLAYTVRVWEKFGLADSLVKNLVNVICCIFTNRDKRQKLSCRQGTHSLPGILPANDELLSYCPTILSIAKLAFDWIFESKETSSVARRSFDLECKMKSPSDVENVFIPEILKRCESFYTSHGVKFHDDTLQYFFAAIWVGHSADAFSELCDYCCDWSKVLEMSDLYIFLCGMDSCVGSRFSKHVADLGCFKLNVGLDSHRAKIGLDCAEEALEHLTKVHVKCITEIKYHRHFNAEPIPLFVRDVYFREESFKKIEKLLTGIVLTLVNLKLEDLKLTLHEWNVLLEVLGGSSCLQALQLNCINVDGTGGYQNNSTKSYCSLQTLNLYQISAPMLQVLSTLLTTVRESDKLRFTEKANKFEKGTTSRGITGKVAMPQNDCPGNKSTIPRRQDESSNNDESNQIGDKGSIFTVTAKTEQREQRGFKDFSFSEFDSQETIKYISVLTELRLQFVSLTKMEYELLLKVVLNSHCLQQLELSNIFFLKPKDGTDVSVQPFSVLQPCIALRFVTLCDIYFPLWTMLSCLKMVPDVHHLFLRELQTKDIPELVSAVTKLSSLKELKLHHVDFENLSLDLSFNVELTTLVLMKVALKDCILDLSKNIQLENLELVNVTFSPLAWENILQNVSRVLTSLKDLSLEGVPCIDHVAVPIQLEVLILKRVILKKGINLSNSKQLKTIDLMSVNMSTTAWEHCFQSCQSLPCLTELRLRHISNMPDALQFLPRLKHIRLVEISLDRTSIELLSLPLLETLELGRVTMSPSSWNKFFSDLALLENLSKVHLWSVNVAEETIQIPSQMKLCSMGKSRDVYTKTDTLSIILKRL